MGFRDGRIARDALARPLIHPPELSPFFAPAGPVRLYSVAPGRRARCYI